MKGRIKVTAEGATYELQVGPNKGIGRFYPVPAHAKVKEWGTVEKAKAHAEKLFKGKIEWVKGS